MEVPAGSPAPALPARPGGPARCRRAACWSSSPASRSSRSSSGSAATSSPRSSSGSSSSTCSIRWSSAWRGSRSRGRRVPAGLLILLVYVVATLVLVELVLLLIGPLVEQVRAFVKDAPGYVDDLNGRLAELLGWWNRLDLPADVKAAIDKAVADLLANVGSIVPAILRPVFSSVLGFVGSVFGYLIIPVWTFWILQDRPAIVRGFDRAVPAEWRADTWATLGIVRRVFGSWVRGQLILGLVVGSATFIGLLVLGALVDPSSPATRSCSR